ncbi:MAG: T9SS type A sorting domain-containing protein [Saprospiraceae bacterium]
MKYFLFFLLLSQQIAAQNILISSEDFPNEPSIMIDPKHPNVLIGGSNLNNYYISIDTGFTWTKHDLNSSYGVWGDPTISVDTTGDFYFFHLSNPQNGNWIDRIVCQKTEDDGQSWSDGTYTGLNGTKAQDKQWCAIDRTNNNIYLTWTQFDKYGTSDPMDSSIILFSKSLDAGNTWSEPKRINKVAGDCLDSDNTVEGAVPAVGPNGEIYVAWAGPDGITFNKSTDQGQSWLPQEIFVSDIPGGWDYAISGLIRCNGLPITACDLSNGPNRGTIYINWSDQRNGTLNTDIFLSKSTDGGSTWSSPLRVNDDMFNHQQFLTWMSIDQATGFLYFVFYDRRTYDDDSTDVFLAVSVDGGTTFINRKISESPFVPTAQVFFGDYNNIIADHGIIRPIWTRLNNGNLSIWTDITTLNDIITSTNETKPVHSNLDFEYYPNPSADITYISFKLHEKSLVSLSIFDDAGKIVHNIINSKLMGYGKYVEKINLNDLNLSDGSYILKLEVNHQIKVSRLIVIRNRK